jgi:membrane associated rhomboid family serine protease
MAFLQPPESRQPAFNVPGVVLLLIGAFVAVHVARNFGLLPDDILERYAFNPALYSQAFLSAHNLDAGPLWLRVVPFVTYIFLHADATHLAINSIWLLAFGPVVARRFGSGLFLVFFFVCGVAAAAVQLAFSWGEFEPMIGASGAISGMMAAAIRMLPLQDLRSAQSSQPLMPLMDRQVLIFSTVWIVINTVSGVTGFAGVGTELRLIAWQAHLGGYLCGLLLVGPLDAWRSRDAVPSALP